MKPKREGAPETSKDVVSNGALSLSDAYQRAIRYAESLPENQPGSDKAWVESSLQEYRAHYARAVRVR